MPLLPHPVWPPLWFKALMWFSAFAWVGLFVTTIHFIAKFW